MKIDLIKYWEESIRKLKWDLGLINEEKLSKTEIDKICEILYTSFPKNYFSYELDKISPEFEKRWMYNILLSNKLSSVYQLLEISILLKYYNKIKDKSEFQLFKKNGEVNEGSFRDILFELFISYLLEENEIKIEYNKSYLDSKGTNRPLDSYFEHEKNGYIIECTKLYNVKAQNLRKLSWRIKDILTKFGEKNEIYLDQLFCGYIGFKKNIGDKKIINQAEIDFRRILKEYFKGISIKNDLLTIPNVFKSDYYDILIQPEFLSNYTQTKKFADSEYKSNITFGCITDGIKTKIVEIQFDLVINHTNMFEFVKDKLKRKFRQHKDSIFQKIVAVEIENTNIENQFGKSLPLKKNDFKSKKITELIKEKQSLLIVLKEVSDIGIKYSLGFAYGNKFDKNLSKKLESLKITSEPPKKLDTII